MQNLKKGVLSGSEIYFHTPSGLEKSMFMYPLCCGHFYCDSRYEINRVGFDNYLIMYIKDGEGELIYEEKVTAIKKGEIIFIDCNKPHTYKTNTRWETLWMHFDGAGAKNYYELICEKLGNVIDIGDGIIYQLLINIFKSYRDNEQMNEAIMSCHIQRILAELYRLSCEKKRSVGIIYDVIQYIEENFKSDISIDDLCETAHLSPFYFCRLFKKEMGYSPYEYIIIVRLNIAKKLLKNSKLTIKEIAYETGFNSEANFIRTFKSYANMTPGKFRKTDF